MFMRMSFWRRMVFVLAMSIGLQGFTSHFSQAEEILDEAADSYSSSWFSKKSLMWINHLGFLPGDPSVQVSFNAIQDLGLTITSTSLGDTAPGGGNKGIETAVQVPPDYIIKGVRVCYNYVGQGSFITQIRLAQTQNPPTFAYVRLDDAKDQTAPGPICVNSTETTVNPAQGPVLLNFRLNFLDLRDEIKLLGTGLWLKKQSLF